MNHARLPILLLSAFVFFTIFASHVYAQVWSGILDPSRAIDWSTAGIPGGIPNRTTTCATLNAATYGNGSNDTTAAIQTALNGCASGDVVSLSSGTFLIDGNLTIPSNVTLRGAGADSTILNAKGTSGAVVTLGSAGSPNINGSVSIASGATSGSTNIVVSTTAGISVGEYLMITELNNPTYFVNDTGSEGSCTWCDGGLGWNGSRVRGQIVEVESINGTTIGISDALFGSYDNPLPGWSANTTYPLNAFINPSSQSTHYYQQTVNNGTSPYTCTSGSSPPVFPTNGTSITDGTCTWLDKGVGTTTQPLATPFSATKAAGVENLQVYANDTGYTENFGMNSCADCWISGVEGNYSDADHVDADYSYHGEIVNSYFSNAFLHTPGSSDSSLDLRSKSTGMLVQNNIFERLHVSIMLEWGAAGNVVAYNYTVGNFDAGAPNAVMGAIDMHGAHPQFNLFEGNVTNIIGPDNTWGSSADNTSFRNWIQGATEACNPTSGRGTVVCTPLGTQGSAGINGWWEFQQSYAVNVTYESRNFNSVGNVVGSAQQSALLAYGNPIGLVNMAVAVCGPSPCGPGSRSYDSTAYAYTIGYGESADDGSSGFDSLLPYSTLLIQGDYSNIGATTTWDNGVQTLPASFYLAAEPAWWNNSIPWPAIGPDVTSGTGPAGHAYANPAELCYSNVMGGSAGGAGSPLTFNASTCYSAASAPSAISVFLRGLVRVLGSVLLL